MPRVWRGGGGKRESERTNMVDRSKFSASLCSFGYSLIHMQTHLQHSSPTTSRLLLLINHFILSSIMERQVQQLCVQEMATSLPFFNGSNKMAGIFPMEFFRLPNQMEMCTCNGSGQWNSQIQDPTLAELPIGMVTTLQQYKFWYKVSSHVLML